MPGPSATAVTRRALTSSVSAGGHCRLENRPASAGQGQKTAVGSNTATEGNTGSGTAIVTYPAPPAKAAEAANTGAPTISREPPIINTCPYVPLWEWTRRTGSQADTCSRVKSRP